MTILVDVNTPGSPEDMVSNWEPVHSLVEGVISGAEITAAPCLPALAVTHLPLCLWGQWEGVPVCSWLALLWYSLNLLFCEWARLDIRAFHGKVLFFPLWQSHSLGCYLLLAPSDCPQGIQFWSLA